MLTSMSNVMLLSQPVQPGSPIPIPIDTSLPIALEACTTALWCVVVLFTVVLLKNTYYWHTLPRHVERMMVEEEASRPSTSWSLPQLTGKRRVAAGPAALDIERMGGGWPCELVLRSGALHVPGVLFLSRNFFHFCAEMRVFELLPKHVISIENILDIKVVGHQQLAVHHRTTGQTIRLSFPTPSLCQRAFDECEVLWKENGQWVWDKREVSSLLVDTDFVSDAALTPRLSTHRNRVRDRDFGRMPPSLGATDPETRVPWTLAGHGAGPHAVWGLYEAHDLGDSAWAALLGGITMHRIAPGTVLCTQGGDPDIWHIARGKVQLTHKRRTIATAGEGSVIGVAPFLLWTLTHKEGEREWEDSDSLEGCDLASVASSSLASGSRVTSLARMSVASSRGASGSARSPPSVVESLSSSVKARAKQRRRGWRWVVDKDEAEPVVAFRFAFGWLAQALEQNPQLRAPVHRYLAQLLADRVERGDQTIVALARDECHRERLQTELARLLDGSPIARGPPDAHRIATREFVQLFDLLESETLLECVPCTSHIAVMNVNDANPPDTTRGRLFFSFHHICFEADARLPHHRHKWQAAIDSVVDMQAMQVERGIEIVFRNSRKVALWGLSNPGHVMETLTIVWKDLDVSASLHPPLPVATLAYGRMRTRSRPVPNDDPVVDLGGGPQGDAALAGSPIAARHRVPSSLRAPSPERVVSNTPEGTLPVVDPGYRSAASSRGSDSGGGESDNDSESASVVEAKEIKVVGAAAAPGKGGEGGGRGEGGAGPRGPATRAKIAAKDLRLPPGETPKERAGMRGPDADECAHLPDQCARNSDNGNGNGNDSKEAKQTTGAKRGLVAGLSARRRRGYDPLEEDDDVVAVEMCEAGGAGGDEGAGEDRDASDAWQRLSMGEKEALFRHAPSIGMLRNQIVLSQETFNHRDPGLYMVEEGVVRVQYRVLNNRARVVMQQLGQGAIFGCHGFLTCLAPRAAFVVDSDRATVKHFTATQLFARLQRDGMERVRAGLYREIALELCVSPSTMLYLERGAAEGADDHADRDAGGQEERWTAYPF